MPWHPTLINSQILSVHATLLPIGAKGKVLMTGGSEHNRDQGATDETPVDPMEVDRTAIYDVDARTDAVKISSPTTDVFCSGHAFIGDGRWLIAGGTESWGGAAGGGPGGGHVHQHGNFGGEQACWLFNYIRSTWERAADLTFEVGPGKGGGRWYPSLITLPSGDVVAFGGHPSRRSNNWHENDIPERYSATGNFWSRYPNAIHFDPTSALPSTWYPRISLLRNGWIFITTTHDNRCRFFDSNTGNLVGPEILPPVAPYNSGWNYSVIQLPLLPSDGYRSRVMAVNGVQPVFIELNVDAGAPTPAWANAGARQGSASVKARTFSCPVYLPTGQILISGGINGSSDTAAVKEPEIFTPNIDWATRSYNAGDVGTWVTIEEPAQIARNYHSVALLLPDGSVMAAGSNIDGQDGDPSMVGQRNIELFLPLYFSNPARPQIVDAPELLHYGDTSFTVETGSVAQAASIRKVALVRCGSVTHAGDFDQRYVALAFANTAGSADLQVTLPNDPGVLPPGFYMLWIVDSADLPCQVAKFVRIAHVNCQIVTERDTFSEEEVLSYAPADARFEYAVYAVFDGFLPDELVGTPAVTLTWVDNGTAVPTSDVELVPTSGRWLEHPPAWEEVAQKITYPYTVIIKNETLYNTITDKRSIRLIFNLHGVTGVGTIDLSTDPNPYMQDIDPLATPPNEYWLSTDVRTFRVYDGDTILGDIAQGSSPSAFLRQIIDRYKSLSNNNSHPFLSLPKEGTAAAVDLWPTDGGRRVFNYAIAKVRYRATVTTATQVKVFFRLCTTAATGLEYNSGAYRNNGPGVGTVPLLGLAGSEISSVPFFLSPRVETRTGQPGATSMASQTLETSYEIQDITPLSGGERVAYFGCYLDINEPTVKRFPLMPGTGPGSWPASSCVSIQELFRSPHQCLVAEVYFEPDQTDPSDTPGSSDNLAQRNLVFLHADNPGAPGSHHVLHPFEIKPSTFQVPRGFIPSAPSGNLLTAVAQPKKFGPDELLIRWHNLPLDCEVTLYFSDIDTSEVQAMASAFRRSLPPFTVIDDHTLRFRVADGTWMPIPGGRSLNIPVLLGVRLPDNIVSGQHFYISIHQVSGNTGRVTGTFQIDIPVTSAVLILDREVRTLSIMKHIATTIPSTNRWYPIFLRYLKGLSDRVDALGGDASSVHPNPDGSGLPYTPPPDTTKDKTCPEAWMTMLVVALALLAFGLAPTVTLSIALGVLLLIVLALVIGRWTRRCCTHNYCTVIEYALMGVVIGLALLLFAGFARSVPPMLTMTLILAAVVAVLLVLARVTLACARDCCDDPRCR